MASRIGIELSPSWCRVVEVHTRRGPTGPLASEGTRVRAFRVLPYEGANPDACAATLRQLFSAKVFSRGVPIAVSIWDLPQALQFLRLPPASPADLETLARREARRDIETLSREGDEASVGVALGAVVPVPAGGTRRELTVVAASGSHIRERLQPFVEAGLEFDAVVTPGLALTSIARLRRGVVPASVEAYVAVAPAAIAIAVVRDGLLLFSREIPWGYETRAGDDDAATEQPGLAERLASELRRSFLFFKQKFRAEVERVMLCGDLPHLRALTAPMAAALQIEVETLDSMDGIDVTALPPPADEFRARVAELRLAWAIAADSAPSINLVPVALRPQREARRQRLVLAAGIAAAVALGGYGYVQADRSARAGQREVESVEREAAALRPRVAQIAAALREGVADQARRAALDAFDTQGVRLARALEVLARAIPPEVLLTDLKVSAAGAIWRATLTGIAISAEPGPAQAAVNVFLRQLHDSPYLGPALRSPQLRMVSGGAQPEQSGDQPGARPAASAIPAGMSGIEFSVDFEIRK